MNENRLQAVASDGLKFDPRTKLLLLILTNSSLFVSRNLMVLIIMGCLPLILLATTKKFKAVLYCTLAYIAAIFANEYLVDLTHGIINMLVVMIAGIVFRMMPGLIMGYYLIITTTVSEFIAAMERMKMPQFITIPLSVMFRFFPTVAQESRSIGDAMRMRGISVTSKRFYSEPLLMLEYRVVPMLMSCVKIGDELSAASLSRGLGNPVKRTNICEIGFGWQDAILIVIALATFTVFLISV